MNLDQILDYFDNPSLIETLSAKEHQEIILNGIFYILEYEISEPDSLSFTRSFLFQNPVTKYKHKFINLLLHKISSGCAEANLIIFDFLFSHPDPNLIHTLESNAILPISEENKTLFALYKNDMAVFHQSPHNLEILTEYFFGAAHTLQKYLIQKAETNNLTNWVILANSVFYDSQPYYDELFTNFEKFSAQEKELTGKLLFQFSQKTQAATDTLFRLYNLYQNEPFYHLIKNHSLHPKNEEEYALFLLFTNHWEEYDLFDFDSSHLKNAFLKATPALRQKILSQSRKSGKFSWLHDLSDMKQTKWVSDLNEGDWENILNRLISDNNDIDLLRMLKILPPIQAQAVISTIQKMPVLPFDFTKDAYWENLTASVNHLPKNLPIPQEISHTKTIPDLILSSEIQQSTQTILLGTPMNLIQKIDLETLKSLLPAITSPAPQVRQMLLTSDQQFLVLAHGDHQIRIMRLADNQIIKALTGHEGLIKKLLLSRDQKTLYSTGFDGKLISWRFPLGPMLQTNKISNQECFDMVSSAGQKSGIICDAEGFIHSFDTASLKTIRKFKAGSSAITSLASSIKTPQIAAYDKSEMLSVWNIESGAQIAVSKISEPPITVLDFSDHDDFLMAGHLSGALSFYSSITTQRIFTKSIHDQPVINLHKIGNHQLIVVFRDGHLSLVDYQLLNTLYTPINLIKGEINFSDTSKQSNLWGDFINSFYRFIHRFDIMIDEEHGIQIGQYDIQIE